MTGWTVWTPCGLHVGDEEKYGVKCILIAAVDSAKGACKL